ncbi:L-threonylcarbamoyladenylate synthase [Candidatus Dependentiae bacterium]|nr:L-threonylcarbamoyladenylate synthase [Candidatus Dependentiae bacterium]
MVKEKLFWGNLTDRSRLIESLKNNEVSIVSTDTVYGFLGNVTLESYDRICFLKNCPTWRPFLILIASPDQESMEERLSRFVDLGSVSNRIVSFLSRCWPGPVTAIFKAKPGLPDFLVSEDGTIALRCPDHDGLQAILPAFEGLFSTSANRTGRPVPEKLSRVSPEIFEQVAYTVVDVVDELDGEIAKREPSSIIDFSGHDDLWRVVREGAYSIEKLKEIYEQTK